MNIKDSFIHLGPGGQNKKALLKDFAITENGITLTRANLLIENNVEVDETLTLSIPTWNLSTTGNAATASALSVIKSTAATAHYLTFVDSNNDSAANENFYTTANISIVPSTGTLTLTNTSAPALVINNTHATTTHDCGILFLRSGVVKGWVGYRSDYGMYIYNKARAKYLNYKDDGSLLFEGNKVWHAGNDGTGSGLDADLLDGQHLSDLDTRYVLKAGDTMTGALTVPSLSVTGAATFSQAINGSILGNAATASRLQNARNIAISGAVTGNANFDGSGNITISTSVNHTHNYAGSGSAGGAATNVVVNSGNDTNSTYPLVWHSGNTLYSTADIYCNPSTDFLYSKGLVVTSGSYISVGTPGGAGSGTAKSYISAGPGYSINAGRYGVKILTCDQSDCLSGLGQDLAIHSGWTNSYNFSIVGGNSSADKGYISFVTHKVNSTTYRYVGGFEDNAGTVTFQVEGSVHASSFVKANGTSAQFLKADGSVDSNTYLTSATAVTNWTVKSDDANYPIAFSPNVTPSASNNAYNTGFTFNPGTKTFNNNGCRQQYDSTNKVLKFIFD